MSEHDEILVETADRVCTITLNRLDRLNAWTPVMAREVRAAVRAAGTDPEVRCIVVTGAGRGFCAGADMNALREIDTSAGAVRWDAPDAVTFPGAPGPDLGDAYPGRFGYLYACPKPVIAAINGPCAGIGLIIALYADLRYAAKDAKFTTSFAERGLVAEHGLAWLLPRLIGEAQALDLLFTARRFRGAEAAALGLVNAALPGDALMGHVAGVARHLAHDVSRRSVAVMKRQIRASYLQDFATSLAAADAEMQESFATFDFREGVDSFVERRSPAFRGC